MSKKYSKILSYISLYLFINLAFLTKFPFMHSDESWLSNLSRNILVNKSFKVTETVFDLYPRVSHAIRILFQSIQIVFMQLFSYDLFTFRLISLVSGCFVLFFIYKILNDMFNQKTALITTILLSLNIQFIYASHFARQEIVLLLIEVLCLYFFYQKKYYRSAIVLGLSVGVHPNAFIIALAIGSIYLYYFLIKKINLKTLLTIIFVPSLFALAITLLSLYFNPNFFYEYLTYGSSLSVDAGLLNKIQGIDDFYSKIFRMISGTYYTPDIRIWFFATIFLLIYIIVKKRSYQNIALIISIISVNIGIIIIGRYNPTSIVFMIPMIYILLANIEIKYVYTIILFISLFNSTYNIYPYINNDYNEYINNIAEYVNPDDKVLANLNTEYYFNNDKLRDYRNLYYLKENNITFSEYINLNEIEFIIYSEEIDFIYERRPIWNIIYGNTYYYYEDMNNFLNNNCELLGEFYDSTYAMRIVGYQNQEYSVKIYKVLN